jgi:hypothetical protein
LDLEALEVKAQSKLLVDSFRGQTGRKGVGFGQQRKKWRKLTKVGALRETVAEIIKEEAEQARLVPLHDYEMQSAWMKWGLDWTMHKDLSWTKILYQYSDKLLKWVLNAQLNTLPTPSNMGRWGIQGDFRCGLCGNPKVGLTHILAGCSWVHNVEHNDRSRVEDRYTWRYNCVLLVLCRAIQAKLKEVNALPMEAGSAAASFVKAGAVVPKARKSVPRLGLLAGARDWECDFDLPELRPSHSAYVFPHDVCETSYRVDGYVVSRSTRVCIVGPELTCPTEERIAHWRLEKTARCERYESKTFRLTPLTLEVGCRGFIPPTFDAGIRQLAFTPAEIRDLRDQCSLMSRRCSFIIWLNRDNRDFKPWRLPL